MGARRNHHCGAPATRLAGRLPKRLTARKRYLSEGATNIERSGALQRAISLVLSFVLPSRASRVEGRKPSLK